MRPCRALLWLALGALLAACAGRSTPPQHPQASAAKAGLPCPADAPAGRYREMTWSEYYADVTEQAWRHGATVYWFNPPYVHSAPAANCR